MNQLLLKKDDRCLQPFPHLIEFGLKKNNTIQFGSLEQTAKDYTRFYYVVDGKFSWTIDKKTYTLYPDDLVFILPGVLFGAEKNFLEIGTVSWIHLGNKIPGDSANMASNEWSNLTNSERSAIEKVISLNNEPVLTRCKEAGAIFQNLLEELSNQEIGHISRVNHLLDELLIIIARQLTRQNSSRRDFPQVFMKLEEKLRQDLSHQWTVEEMAAFVGLGITAFSERAKNYTGFSPLHYLINLRISEAIRLLKRNDMNITDIALDTGFYSSQHFATTFKKLTGYTPTEFRKINSTNN